MLLSSKFVQSVHWTELLPSVLISVNSPECRCPIVVNWHSLVERHDRQKWGSPCSRRSRRDVIVSDAISHSITVCDATHIGQRSENKGLYSRDSMTIMHKRHAEVIHHRWRTPQGRLFLVSRLLGDSSPWGTLNSVSKKHVVEQDENEEQSKSAKRRMTVEEVHTTSCDSRGLISVRH